MFSKCCGHHHTETRTKKNEQELALTMIGRADNYVDTVSELLSQAGATNCKTQKEPFRFEPSERTRVESCLTKAEMHIYIGFQYSIGGGGGGVSPTVCLGGR